ncbi:peptidylprolyl isomerase [Tepidibacillus fermentans]|uniref:Foldase protein PrsA n=1 Tax=Tepidibacillus fermentans TaxID=1281767 RepID=A0A4R3KB46_9BACI|nr:peptidylprolyl isomerase [Tepidibacillus fermentans]TCS80160.1 foldase protein PrsA [Tepidibacillus fermentans]
MSRKIKQITVFVFSVVVILTAFGCNNNQDSKKVIAEYKGGQVLQSDFDKYLNVLQFINPQVVNEIKDQNVKKQLLQQFIAERYLGTKEKLSSQNEQDVDNMFQYLKAQKMQMVGSEENYQKELKNLKITEDDIKEILKREIGIQLYFEKQITKDQLKQAFEKSQQDFTIATVSHILIGNTNRSDEEAKKRADEVLTKLKAGGDFAKLAKEYSDDPGSKDKGGTYENESVAKWVPEFKDAVLKQPIGKISDKPVKTQYGYHIIKVISRKVPTFEQLNNDDLSIIKQQLVQQKFSNFMTKELPNIITKMNLPEDKNSK